MKAILFDFDGTLVDSQKIVDRHITSLLKGQGIILKEEENKFTKGMSVKDFAKWLFKNKQLIIRAQDLILPNEIINQIPLIEGAKETLALCKSRGYKIALVTNSPRTYTEKMLEKFSLRMYFDTTITEDEAIYPKPNPKMLEMACKNLGVNHQDCVMIDDNAPGIIAGNKLGMITIRIGKEKEEAKYGVANVSQLPQLLEKIHFTHQ